MSTDGQSTKWLRNIAENFNRLSRVYTSVTDRQMTDGWATAYSERKRELTFAKKYSNKQWRAKSRMRGSETPYPIWIRFYRVLDVPGLVTYANFAEDRLRSLVVAGRGVKVFPSLLTLIVAFTTVSRTAVRVCDLTVKRITAQFDVSSTM